ncbi:hypothetical protein ACNPQM_02995 [Streptomyces sp. NPDC056231]|uniref:hypothetical protein n=1 Tax=Streptomyces sp. NPDC056231 TaxID=3345755 RepID=UPI003AAB31A1
MTDDTPPSRGLAAARRTPCFARYAAQRAVTAACRPLLDGLGLMPRYLVMLVLRERGGIPVKELAGALHLGHGTVSPLS